jgi:ATP-dependent DNA helicase RecG
MQFARQEWSLLQAYSYAYEIAILDQFIANLPFSLTQAQKRVHEEIRQDLTQKKPMLRLVQGDVGSGKTVIAALSALQVITQNHQVALMAPTELLSEQHTLTLKKWLEPFNICVMRLSGKMKIKERRATLDALKNQTCHLIIGTHAIFQEPVEFKQLGLIIIDEQHRFGVEQRLLLQKKGNQNFTPHQLMMTATPIPRTLAMTQFAHLDLSIIDELPPGRTPIVTTVIPQSKRDTVIERLKQMITMGHQAYWVCTLIDESEKLQCMAASSSAEKLQIQLPNARIGLVHGRMRSNEKEQTMQAFKTGTIDLLVATTVIEVGVDVPNASLMIIENAERLGLSQLHQLRGRVGRGNQKSYCLLLYQGPLSKIAVERLRLLKETTDGFILAEKDLQLRGSGQILGKAQTGYRSYKIAVLPRDQALLETVCEITKKLIQQQPNIAKEITTRWLGDYESFFQV